MYKKAKIMIFSSIAVLLVLTFVAFAVATGTNKSGKGMNFSVRPQDNYVEEKRQSEEPQQKLPKNNVIRVSEDTKNYMFPEQDPLKEIDNENNPQFETPNIPNVTNKENKQQNKITEYDPFKAEQSNSAESAKSTATMATSSNLSLYNIDNSPAVDYEIIKDFSIDGTQFYVIGYKPASIQRFAGFVNRKYYIYKKSSETIVQCFDLFERQERQEKNPQSLISIEKSPEDTKILFNGANSVSRVIENSRLLSPYSDKKDRVLLLKQSK